LPDTEQAVSLSEKPEPETLTVDPPEPNAGPREMDGALRVSVEVWLEIEVATVEDDVRLAVEVELRVVGVGV